MVGLWGLSFSCLSQALWPSFSRSLSKEVIQGLLPPERHFCFSLSSPSVRTFSFYQPDVWNILAVTWVLISWRRGGLYLHFYFLKVGKFFFYALLSNSGILFYELLVYMICSFLQWNHLTSCCWLLNVCRGINRKYILCILLTFLFAL